MKSSLLSICVVLVVALPLASVCRAQTISNFASTNLTISGAELSVTDTAAAIFGGRLSVNASGAISGVILLRNFATNATNSTLTNANIRMNMSRVFGPVVNQGTATNISSDGYYTNETRRTVYSADFYIATAVTNVAPVITNFFVKGRAIQTVLVSIFSEPSGLGANTNYNTNVSLEGASFGAGNRRGFFNAYAPY